MAGDITEGDAVAVAGGRAARPSPKSGPVPLEAMLGMPEPVKGNAEQRVELRVRGRDHHGRRPHPVEHGALQEGQLSRIDVLDGFDQGRAIEAGKRRTALGHRAVDEVDPGHARRGHRVEPGAQATQRLGALVDPDDAFDPGLDGQSGKKVAVTAPKVQDASGAAVLHDLVRRLQALLVQPGGHPAVGAAASRRYTSIATPPHRIRRRHTPSSRPGHSQPAAPGLPVAPDLRSRRAGPAGAPPTAWRPAGRSPGRRPASERTPRPWPPPRVPAAAPTS